MIDDCVQSYFVIDTIVNQDFEYLLNLLTKHTEIKMKSNEKIELHTIEPIVRS